MNREESEDLLKALRGISDRLSGIEQRMEAIASSEGVSAYPDRFLPPAEAYVYMPEFDSVDDVHEGCEDGTFKFGSEVILVNTRRKAYFVNPRAYYQRLRQEQLER